jgi:hypothetical protein
MPLPDRDGQSWPQWGTPGSPGPLPPIRPERPLASRPALPTATVVFDLFTPVTLVHFAVDNVPILHVHGIREDHLIICEAVGIDRAWYQGAAAGQNSLLSATPP